MPAMPDYSEGLKKEVVEIKFLIHDLRVERFINEVIHFLLTQEGQNAVADSGLLPGPPEFIQIALKRLSR